ncbi:MAG TPA: hypothetical protein VE553_07665 [Candidatus Binatia bacterium]|jgi:hypothetical protein|nr:hypothetical protein [Candidatus Binatia bacterium]
MKKKLFALLFVAALLVVAVVPALAAGPNFGSAIYADGQTWGTKGNSDLPAPTDNDRQSFDGLYKFTNGVEGQLPVAEAAPGNPAYNGGRWIEYFVTWNIEPVHVTSFAELQPYLDSGDATVVESGNYFQCPLLPVK